MEKNKTNKVLVIIIVILLLIMSGGGYYLNSKITSLNMAEQNIKSLNDSLRLGVNKIGELEASKQVLITKSKNLKDLNTELDAEVKKEKGKVYNLTQIIAGISNLPIPDEPLDIHTTIKVYPDSAIGLAWNNDTIYDKYNYRFLSGESKFKYDSLGVTNLGTVLYKDNLGFNLVTGLRKLDGKLEIFVRSGYPGFNVTKLDGAIIDPKKNPVFKEFIKPKKFHIGPMGGIGVGSGFEFTPFIGVGVMYSIFSF